MIKIQKAYIHTTFIYFIIKDFLLDKFIWSLKTRLYIVKDVI